MEGFQCDANQWGAATDVNHRSSPESKEGTAFNPKDVLWNREQKEKWCQQSKPTISTQSGYSTQTSLSVHGNRSCPDHLLVYMHLSQIKVYTSLFLPCSSHFLIYMIDFLCDLSSILSNILEVQNSILKRIYNCHTKAISRKNIIPSITSIKQKIIKS